MPLPAVLTLCAAMLAVNLCVVGLSVRAMRRQSREYRRRSILRTMERS